jgi:hypothetical protein
MDPDPRNDGVGGLTDFHGSILHPKEDNPPGKEWEHTIYLMLKYQGPHPPIIKNPSTHPIITMPSTRQNVLQCFKRGPQDSK